MFLDEDTPPATNFLKSLAGNWGTIAALMACIFMIVGLTTAARAYTEAPAERSGPMLVRPNDVNSGTLLFPAKEPGFYVEAPRLKTDVTIDVSGPVARVKVTQRFENPSKGWVEGTYVFPLPENSAVDELRMQIGERFIEGQIKPREEARQIYEQAKQEGKKAALLEQQRPNIFTNQVANIGPGETIVVQIEYQQTVRQSGGEFSLRFPMVVAPRYNPAPIVEHVEFNGNAGFAVPRDPVEHREKIEAPVLDPHQNAKINPVTLTVDLKAGFPLGEVKVPFHEVTITEDGGENRKIVLKAESVPADRDFELTWRAEPGKTPSAGLFRETVGGKDYLLAFVTPPTAPDLSRPTTREVVFVLDNSGSMSGPSIEQARQSLALAIGRLKSDDRFNVIRFDDTMTDVFGGLVPANGDNREKAIAYVNALEAEGGTEMLPALRAALVNQGPVAPEALRQVVFLTDGAIGNEAELFAAISGDRGAARVFTVGIGSAPNSHFMSKAAELGRGTFTHIGSETQITERMGELFAKLENPVMTDISAHFDTATGEITPNPIPDLYAGEPVVLTAKLAATAGGKLQILGKTGDQPWRVELDIANAASGKGIAKLWARRKIDDIEARGYLDVFRPLADKEIEAVAMAHHLVSRMTSLVAVDVTPSRPVDQPLGQTKLPLNLPEGWDFDKVYGKVQGLAPKAAGVVQPDVGGMDTEELTETAMAAAPTPAVASLLAKTAAGVPLPQTATLADQRILLGLLMLAFAGMAAGSFGLWRRSLRDIFRAEEQRRGH